MRRKGEWHLLILIYIFIFSIFNSFPFSDACEAPRASDGTERENNNWKRKRKGKTFPDFYHFEFLFFFIATNSSHKTVYCKHSLHVLLDNPVTVRPACVVTRIYFMQIIYSQITLICCKPRRYGLRDFPRGSRAKALSGQPEVAPQNVVLGILNFSALCWP